MICRILYEKVFKDIEWQKKIIGNLPDWTTSAHEMRRNHLFDEIRKKKSWNVFFFISSANSKIWQQNWHRSSCNALTFDFLKEKKTAFNDFWKFPIVNILQLTHKHFDCCFIIFVSNANSFEYIQFFKCFFSLMSIWQWLFLKLLELKEVMRKTCASIYSFLGIEIVIMCVKCK